MASGRARRDDERRGVGDDGPVGERPRLGLEHGAAVGVDDGDLAAAGEGDVAHQRAERREVDLGGEHHAAPGEPGAQGEGHGGEPVAGRLEPAGQAARRSGRRGGSAAMASSGLRSVSTGSRPASARCREKSWSVTRIGRSEPSTRELQRDDVGDLRQAEGEERDLLLDAERVAVDPVADDEERREPAPLDHGVEVGGEARGDAGQVLVRGALQLVARDPHQILADQRQRRGGDQRREDEELGTEREAHDE